MWDTGCREGSYEHIQHHHHQDDSLVYKSAGGSCNGGRHEPGTSCMKKVSVRLIMLGDRGDLDGEICLVGTAASDV